MCHAKNQENPNGKGQSPLSCLTSWLSANLVSSVFRKSQLFTASTASHPSVRCHHVPCSSEEPLSQLLASTFAFSCLSSSQQPEPSLSKC